MPHVGYRIVGTIKEVKGFCIKGHKEGEEKELDRHDSGGLCGFFYHGNFPNLIMLQVGGCFPVSWVEFPNVMEHEYPDRNNAIKIELRRLRDYS